MGLTPTPMKQNAKEAVDSPSSKIFKQKMLYEMLKEDFLLQAGTRLDNLVGPFQLYDFMTLSKLILFKFPVSRNNTFTTY